MYIPKSPDTVLRDSILSLALALKNTWSRRNIGLLSIVKVVCDARVGALVRTGQADCSRCLARTAGDDVYLCALHVELRSRVGASRVKSNQLTTKQVLAWSDTSGNSDGLFALVGDQAIDTPFCAVEGVFRNLNIRLASRTEA